MIYIFTLNSLYPLYLYIVIFIIFLVSGTFIKVRYDKIQITDIIRTL